MKHRHGTWYAMPLAVWLSLFLVIPIGIVLLYSILTRDPQGTGVQWILSLDAFTAINTSLIKPVWVTLFVALVSSLITIIIALPVSYYLARTKNNTTLLLLVVIPFWVNFLIRVWAWMAVLGTEGFLNDILRWLGISKEPIQFLHNLWAVVIVHVYTYLPFAILPLYATVEKFDFQLLEAARDLGASHLQSLVKVMLPCIRSGIFTSVMFTFIPTLGSFAISDLVGGKEGYMLGNAIDYAIRTGRNWPRAAALSVLLMLLTSIGLLLYYLVQRASDKSSVKEVN
jgi:spermidine/putrescine transport system permease protein